MNVDKKIARLGFEKIYEDATRCTYKRFDEKYKFCQNVVIQKRTAWNEFRLMSYDTELMDAAYTGNVCVALTLEEVTVFYKKMKQKTRDYKLLKFIRRV